MENQIPSDSELVPVHSAENEMEAGFLVSVLKDNGILAYSNDEYKSTIAWGAVPPTELTYQILVPEYQLQAAKDILSSMTKESLPTDEEIINAGKKNLPDQTITSRKSYHLWFLILGFITGAVSTALLFHPGYQSIKDYLSYRTVESDTNNDGKIDRWIKSRGSSWVYQQLRDRNGDGKPDEHINYDKYDNVDKAKYDDNYNGYFERTDYYENGIRARTERDINNDSKVDEYAYYNESDYIDRMKSDNDYDGYFERNDYYKNGVLEKSEIDLNNDGKIDCWFDYKDLSGMESRYDLNFDGNVDRWDFYEKGLFSRGEWDTDFDGKVDKWSYYENDILIRSEWDVNGDGKPDNIKRYDRFENEIR